MIALLKTHTNIILTTKVLYIILGMIGLVIMVLLSFSEFFINENSLVTNRDFYLHDYLLESISFIKVVIVLNGVFLVVVNRFNDHIDYLLVQRSTRLNVIISKLISLVLLNVIIVSILYGLMYLIGVFLTPYVTKIEWMIYVNLVLFSIVYLLLGYYIYIKVKTIYSLLFVVILYLGSSVFSPYGESFNNLDSFSKIVGFIIPDIYCNEFNQFVFMYGLSHVFLIILVFLFLIIAQFQKSDII